MTSTLTRPVDNVVIATKGLQERNTNIIAGTTVENKGKLILTEIFPSVLNMIFKSIYQHFRLDAVKLPLSHRVAAEC